MKWNEIIVNTNTEGTEIIADAFFSIGCNGGVKIIDKQDIIDVMNSEQMWDYIDEDLLNESTVAKVSSFASLEETKTVLAKLNEYLESSDVYVGEIAVVEVDDDVWYNSWKKYYAPIEADRYVVVPRWINYEVEEGKIKILMEPGMAFGTGEHESTKMCLKLMSKLEFVDKNVIDVGTGSGILGIGALLSGAKSCYMCDLDSLAIKSSKENSKINGVEDRAEIVLADLLEKNNMQAEIVLANLTANILIRLSKDIGRFLEKDGYLVCSGIIHSRLQDVKNAFVEANFKISSELVMGEWDALMFQYLG